MPNPKASSWFSVGYLISHRRLNIVLPGHWAVIVTVDVVLAGLGLIVSVGDAALATADECTSIIISMSA